MNAEQARRQAGVKIPGRGRELSELRRRAGLHGRRRPSRGTTNRRAIAADYRAG